MKAMTRALLRRLPVTNHPIILEGLSDSSFLDNEEHSVSHRVAWVEGKGAGRKAKYNLLLLGEHC